MENQLLTQYCLHRESGICRNGILCGQCAEDATSRDTVDNITWKSHKTITQMNHTNE